MKINKKGFTLIELLVVIAIIGILSTLAIVALNTARGKAKDATRVNAMKQLQTSLEMVYNDNVSYALTQDLAGTVPCAANNAVSSCVYPVKTYLPSIETLNDPGALPATLCTADPLTSPKPCNYAYTTVPDTSIYVVHFYLENRTGDLPAGFHTVTEKGIQ